METGGRSLLTGRTATLGFMALSAVLALALVISLGAWNRERASLNGRIAELTQQRDRSQAVWKAQLAACHAATSERRVMRTGASAADDAAGRLLAQGPEGIDVCARMESADQAVLATLK